MKTKLIIATALTLALAACSIVPKPTADPTRHYVLAAPADTKVAGASISRRGEQDAPPTIIGLRTVMLPAYLTGSKSIAVRQGRNEIIYRDYDRWAEPLDDAIARIVRERLLATGAVSAVEPLPGAPVRTYDLTIRILESEGVLTDTNTNTAATIRFAAEYELKTPEGASLTGGTRTFTAPPAAWDGKDYAALAAQLAAAAAALADDIAKNLPTAK